MTSLDPRFFRDGILVALAPHRGHDGRPSASDNSCLRCNAERVLDVLLQDPAKPEPPRVSGPAPGSVEALEAERDAWIRRHREAEMMLADVMRENDRQRKELADKEHKYVSETVMATECERDAAEAALKDARFKLGVESRRCVAAEAGRDQAIKERDHYRHFLAGLADTASDPEDRKIAADALAGVPGGGRPEQDLGGDRGQSPVVKTEGGE